MQTKLNKAEKQLVRGNLDMLRVEGGDVFSFPDKGVTVAIAPAFPGSRMAMAAVAIAAPTEKKFRKLVGVNQAMCKHENGEGVQMMLPPEFWEESTDDARLSLANMADALACAVHWQQ